MTRRRIDLDQLFVAVLQDEPWQPDAAGAAIRAARRRQRRNRGLVVAATAAAVTAVLVALPSLGLLPGRGAEPVVVAGPPVPSLAADAPTAVQRPPLSYPGEAVRLTREGSDWVMARPDVLGVAGERAPAVPGQLRAAVLFELVDRHGEASVGPVRAAAGDYSTAMAEGKPLAWVNATVLRAGSGRLPVRVALWLSHPASWEGCGVGEVECRVQAFENEYGSASTAVVSYREVARDPATGAEVSTWWARGLLYRGLLSTVAVQAPLGREEAIQLARDAITLTY